MRRRLRLDTGTTFRSFQTRNFRLFFAGQLVSQAGTWMQTVAIVWVVLDLTDSGTALGLVTACEYLPMLLGGAWTGLLVDRVDRHRLMVATQLAYTALAAAFTVLVLTGSQTVVAMYGLSLVFGTITAFDNPARRVLVSELVAPDDLPNAVGLNSALMTGSRIVGPALAGALIAGPGPGACFALNTLSYLAVIGALLRMNPSEFRAAPPVSRAKGQLREGFRYMWRTPELRVPLTLVGVIGITAFNYQVSLPLLAERTFDGDATSFTLLYSAMSTGSLGGALAVARRRSVDLSFLVRTGAGLALAMSALAFAPSLPLAVVAAVPVGFTSIFLISGSSAAIQLIAAPSMRGRVLALLAMLVLGSPPIGGPLVGWIADVSNARLGIAVGGVATAAATAWVAHRRRADTRPAPGPEVEPAEPVAA